MAGDWLPLKEGDTVDLVAPGFACTPEELRGALHFLAGWGLEARVPRKLFGQDVICSHDDVTRLKHLKEALLAPDSRAVWCVRGGYGSIRLIPELAKLKRPKGPPKLFIGLSDISTLHLFLNQCWGWPTVHGPMLDRLGKGAARPTHVREMKRFVFGRMEEIRFAGLKPMNTAARRAGIVKGTVSGGNLITLQSSLGTEIDWDTSGQILFFEEIGERGYRVDRALEQLCQAGRFKNARAVVFGEFTGGHENDGSTRIPGVLRRFAEAMTIPVLSGLKSGHGVIQRPVPFGTSAELRLSPGHAELICATGALREDDPV